MTIKDMEFRTGLTRANIRFYENEGFLSPSREKNGYRTYSEEDFDVLMRIRLLRNLRLPLAEIRALVQGKKALTGVLEQHITVLQAERMKIQRAEEVCQEICNAGVRFDNLKAERYLDQLNWNTKTVQVPKEDVLPILESPGRRFFARQFDLFFYSFLCGMVLNLAFDRILSNLTPLENLWMSVGPMLIMLLVEPICITLFRTTPGKWILGLRVMGDDQRRLPLAHSFRRTLSVLFHGMGFNLPILRLILLNRSMNLCADGQASEWEYDTSQILKDKRSWRIWLLVFAFLAVLGLGVYLNLVTARSLPPATDTVTIVFS